jgi:hypothetical protein
MDDAVAHDDLEPERHPVVLGDGGGDAVADVVVVGGWRDGQGGVVDLVAELRKSSDRGLIDRTIWIECKGRKLLALRLVAVKKPEQAAAEARRKAHRSAQKGGHLREPPANGNKAWFHYFSAYGRTLGRPLGEIVARVIFPPYASAQYASHCRSATTAAEACSRSCLKRKAATAHPFSDRCGLRSATISFHAGGRRMPCRRRRFVPRRAERPRAPGR